VQHSVSRLIGAPLLNQSEELTKLLRDFLKFKIGHDANEMSPKLRYLKLISPYDIKFQTKSVGSSHLLHN
jgi:hypothetical protein